MNKESKQNSEKKKHIIIISLFLVCLVSVCFIAYKFLFPVDEQPKNGNAIFSGSRDNTDRKDPLTDAESFVPHTTSKSESAPNDTEYSEPSPDSEGVFHTYILDGQKYNVTYSDGEDPESGEGIADTLYNTPGGVYTDSYQFRYDNSPFHFYRVQQYDELVYADQDYDQMRLTLMWIDVKVEPWSLRLLNSDETIEYEPVESFPGTRVYLIDNVKSGDVFVFKFDWPNPGGIDIQQEEEADYEDYYLNRM